MIGEKLKEEIRKLYLSFDSAESYYEKGFIWSFLTLVADLFSDDEITMMFKDISLKCLKEEKEFINDKKMHEKEINKFMKENKKFFRNNIPKPYEIEKPIHNDLPSRKYDYLVSILESFLKTQSQYFYNFYKKMIQEERIIMGKNSQVSFSSINTSKTFIFLEKFENLYDVMILVHELAHAYYYEINGERLIDRAIISNEIKDEIPSRMVELNFIRYGGTINLFKTYKSLKKEYDYLIYNYDQYRSNYEMMQYVIGSYLAYQLENRYQIEDYFHHVYQEDFRNLILEARNKLEKENKGKVLRK